MKTLISNLVFCFVCLRLVCPMLPVSLDGLFVMPLRCSLTFIYSFSGWSICDAPSVFSNVYLQFLWMVYL